MAKVTVPPVHCPVQKTLGANYEKGKKDEY